MRLEDFSQAVNDWRDYCRGNTVSSNTQSYLDCDPCRNIVSMRKGVLPLIRDELKREYSRDWEIGDSGHF